MTVSGGSCGSAGSSKCHSITFASPKQCKCEPGTPCRGIVGQFSNGRVFSVNGHGSGIVLCPRVDREIQAGGTHGGHLLSRLRVNDPRGVDALLQRTREQVETKVEIQGDA